jgi:hypothetical protein
MTKIIEVNINDIDKISCIQPKFISINVEEMSAIIIKLLRNFNFLSPFEYFLISRLFFNHISSDIIDNVDFQYILVSSLIPNKDNGSFSISNSLKSVKFMPNKNIQKSIIKYLKVNWLNFMIVYFYIFFNINFFIIYHIIHRQIKYNPSFFT